MRKNTVKLALAEGKLQLGTGFGQLRSQEIATILAAAGFHWAFLDTEHGGFDLETVQDICRLAVMVGLSPIVRVADLQYSLIARALAAPEPALPKQDSETDRGNTEELDEPSARHRRQHHRAQ